MKYFKSVLLFTSCLLLFLSCQPLEEPTGAIYVESNPTGADVYLDGQSTGKKTNCNLENVKIGGRTIKLTKSGYLDWQQTVTVNQGQTSTVDATLTTTTGNIQVNSTPTEAKIYLDGTDTGNLTDCLLTNLAAGNHSIKLTKSGYADWQQTVTVNPGQTTTVNATLDPTGGYILFASGPVGAKIYLDGMDTGYLTDCPFLLDNVPVGNHTIKLTEISGWADWQQTVTVVEDETTTVNVRLTTEVGYYDTPGEAMDICVMNWGGPIYAYVADGNSGLRIIDVSTPSTPTELGHCDTPGTAYGVCIRGVPHQEAFAFIADGNSGLRIIDISNPSNPTEVGHYDTPGTAYGVCLYGAYAYVADGNSGLLIIDISNPSNPTEVGHFDTPGTAYGVWSDGYYAFVADGNSGLRVIDVQQVPITEVGHCDTPGTAYDVCIMGNYAYVADGNSGLRVFYGYKTPYESYYIDTPGTAYGVYYEPDHPFYMYVADGNSGLRIIDISNRTEVGYYDTPGTARGVWCLFGYNYYAYVADGNSGLRIINYQY